MASFKVYLEKYNRNLTKKVIWNEVVNFLSRYLEQDSFKMPIGEEDSGVSFVSSEAIKEVVSYIEKEILGPCEKELTYLESQEMEAKDGSKSKGKKGS